MPRLAQLRFLALAAVLAIVFAGSRCGGPRDYLPAELRARVEALKADVRREPTTAETIAARNEVFWEWLNAYSLTGGPVPPNGPSVASWIFQTAFENERARGSLQDFEKLLEAEKATHRSALFPDDSLARQLDDLIYELAFKDEQPDGLGTLSLDAAGPVPHRLVADDRTDLRRWQRAPAGGSDADRRQAACLGRRRLANPGSGRR